MDSGHETDQVIRSHLGSPTGNLAHRLLDISTRFGFFFLPAWLCARRSPSQGGFMSREDRGSVWPGPIPTSRPAVVAARSPWRVGFLGGQPGDAAQRRILRADSSCLAVSLRRRNVAGATVVLTCATMLVTAAATLACDGVWRGAIVLGGEAETVSSIPSFANSSRSEEGTKSCAGCALADGWSTGMTGLPEVVVRGSWITLSPDCDAVASLGGRTSPSGIGGLNMLPQRPSRNAGQRWLHISSWTGTL